MTQGNYWIYLAYSEQQGLRSESLAYDSLVIVGDTLVQQKKYAIVHTYNLNELVRKNFVRDSSGTMLELSVLLDNKFPVPFKLDGVYNYDKVGVWTDVEPIPHDKISFKEIVQFSKNQEAFVNTEYVTKEIVDVAKRITVPAGSFYTTSILNKSYSRILSSWGIDPLPEQQPSTMSVDAYADKIGLVKRESYGTLLNYGYELIRYNVK